jgi:hypothetical protein
MSCVKTKVFGDLSPAERAQDLVFEQDLVRHVHNGYQLETDSLGGDPLLRRLKDSEVIRPLSATRNTIKALEERGLIAPAGGDDPLRIVWHLQKDKTAKKSRR